MSFWNAVLWCLIPIGIFTALFGLHCLGLWLEKQGWLFYKHKKPTSSAASCFVALQQVLEPPIQHVLHVKEEKRNQAEEGVPRRGDPPCGKVPTVVPRGAENGAIRLASESSETSSNCTENGDGEKGDI